MSPDCNIFTNESQVSPVSDTPIAASNIRDQSCNPAYPYQRGNNFIVIIMKVPVQVPYIHW